MSGNEEVADKVACCANTDDAATANRAVVPNSSAGTCLGAGEWCDERRMIMRFRCAGDVNHLIKDRKLGRLAWPYGYEEINSEPMKHSCIVVERLERPVSLAELSKRMLDDVEKGLAH